MLKRYLHCVLVWFAPLCFNILNFLLGGNLPPLGGACVIVEDQGRFLLVVQTDGRVSFPGGFMRWREHPAQTARRECREETGLDVDLGESIGTYSNVSRHPFQVSTLNIAYAGKLVDGGSLRGSIEGHPRWMTEEEMRDALSIRYINILEDYFAHRQRMES